MSLRRYLEKFTSLDGSSLVYTFPLNGYAMEQTQPLLAQRAVLTGASYEYDLMGDAVSPKANGFDRVSFLSVNATPATIDTDLDAVKSKLRLAAKGKLWTLDSNGDRRWAYARLQDMPDLSMDINGRNAAPVVVVFSRFSDWYGEDVIEDSPFTIGSDPDTFTVVNPGNARIYNAVITLKGTYTNPVLTNTTNGYILQSSRDGSSSSHHLRFDCGKGRVDFSTDNGATFAGDYANFVRQSNQVQLMVLEPGDNDFSIAGMSSGVVAVDAYGAWE